MAPTMSFKASALSSRATGSSPLPKPKATPSPSPSTPKPIPDIQIPSSFLTGPPPPTITCTPVDLTPIHEYSHAWAVLFTDVLSTDECRALLTLACSTTTPAGTWDRALVNIGNGRQAMYEDIRKCGRIIWDSPEIAAKILERVRPYLGEIERLEGWAGVTGMGPKRRGETWRMTRLNERLRFLKYEAEEYFKPHCDGCYVTPDEKERSYFTLHLYLNDAESDPEGRPLKGGATTFWSWDMKQRIDVEPRMGSILMFQHRDLIHSGDDVVQGVKYTVRTDVMYEKEVKEE